MDVQTQVWCVAKGSDQTGWEALCVDLDIAVSGSTFEDAKRRLNHAIATYVEDALKESPEVTRELLNRRAPFHVRAGWNLRFLLRAIFGSRRNHTLRAGFDLPCPA